jgi:hypothetical protein
LTIQLADHSYKMILALASLGGIKSKITTKQAHAPDFQDHESVMILDLSLLFGINSKITTENPEPR